MTKLNGRMPGFVAGTVLDSGGRRYRTSRNNDLADNQPGVIPQQIPKHECGNWFLNTFCSFWDVTVFPLCMGFAFAGDPVGYNTCMKSIITVHAPWCVGCYYWTV